MCINISIVMTMIQNDDGENYEYDNVNDHDDDNETREYDGDDNELDYGKTMVLMMTSPTIITKNHMMLMMRICDTSKTRFYVYKLDVIIIYNTKVKAE